MKKGEKKRSVKKTGKESGFLRFEHFCKRFCELVPQKKRNEKVFPELVYAGIEDDFGFWLGKRIVLVVLAGLIGLLVPWSLGGIIAGLFGFEFVAVEFAAFGTVLVVPLYQLLAGIALGIVLGIGTGLVFYLHLYYMIDGRKEMVEGILPDFLLLVASNINAGMTPFSSFRFSARKEFGPLAKEIKVATSKSLGTESFQHALKELTKRIKSTQLAEVVSFFGQAVKSGGHLAKLLETSANDLQQTQEMKKELVSSTKMYVIFVVFVVVIGTPLLLGISVQFLEMITAIQAQSTVGSADVAAVSFLATEINISPGFMQGIAYVLLFGNAVLSSLFIGVISTGKAKIGLKHMPVILFASILVFIVSGVFLKGFLG